MALKSQDNVVSSWATLIDDFNTSGMDFFAEVKAAVESRAVPAVSFQLLDIKESGVLSDKRTYLRIKRDDLHFDLGAAPYGTGFFFSWWLVRQGARYPWAYTLGFFLVVLLTFGMISNLYGLAFGFLIASVVLVVLGRSGLIGPEEHVTQAPLIGGLYRRFVNPATYHSLDVVAMFQESIRRAVNEALDATLKQQGRQALSPKEKELGGLFNPVVRP